MATEGRGNRISPGYQSAPQVGVSSMDKIYIGIVKDVKDFQRMGRLRVWIPELYGEQQEERHWFTVSYASMFAGATPIMNEKNEMQSKKNGQEWQDSQQSYGWWGVPPHVNNEVAVFFAAGNAARGYWFACVYQQFMNHMVPGIAKNIAWQGDTCESHPPVTEYNAYSDNLQPPDPNRPRFEPLHGEEKEEGLFQQGLYKDPERGTETASARRDEISHSYGLKTPAGWQWVLDDIEGGRHMRLRGPRGTQILIHDDAGYIYIVSRKGKSWVEISDDGIDMFTEESLSMRARKNIEIRADQDINVHVGHDLNTRIENNHTDHVGADRDVEVEGSHAEKIGGTLDLLAVGVVTEASGTQWYRDAPKIDDNAPGPPPSPPTVKEAVNKEDRPSDGAPCYEAEDLATIVDRLPTHEPFSLHPKSDVVPQKKDETPMQVGQIDLDGLPA